MEVDAEHRHVVTPVPLEIVRVPVLSDNYSWLLHDADTATTIVVDPGETEPVLAAARLRGWSISEIWNTHWHPDHVGGNAAIVADTGARVIGPEAERGRIGHLDRGVAEGDTIAIGAHRADVLAVPGHTAGHVAFHFADDAAIFTGDTLFAMGCGRLFEGEAAAMFANMRRYAALPDATRVYCGHEYTQANGRYALVAEPGNAAIAARMVAVDAARAAGEATVPTTIGEERATNPFLRANDVATFARMRREKDDFAG